MRTKTPLRLSFAGGGTDFPDFYQKHGGAVVSSAIDTYMHVTVERAKHSTLNDGPLNDIARECLELLESPPVSIATHCDVQACSGLGSSGAFTVGLLHALHAMKGDQLTPQLLEEQATLVELELLERPIGRQDQLASAYGGTNLFVFERSGKVLRQGLLPYTLFANLLVFFTGVCRDSASVLTEQKQRIEEHEMILCAMRDQARALARNQLQDLLELSRIMREGWALKKQLASGITNPAIDDLYERGMAAGATAGKLAGAGGGGFLVFLVPLDKQNSVRRAVNLPELQVRFAKHGSSIV